MLIIPILHLYLFYLVYVNLSCFPLFYLSWHYLIFLGIFFSSSYNITSPYLPLSYLSFIFFCLFSSALSFPLPTYLTHPLLPFFIFLTCYPSLFCFPLHHLFLLHYIFTLSYLPFSYFSFSLLLSVYFLLHSLFHCLPFLLTLYPFFIFFSIFLSRPFNSFCILFSTAFLAYSSSSSIFYLPNTLSITVLLTFFHRLIARPQALSLSHSLQSS